MVKKKFLGVILIIMAILMFVLAIMINSSESIASIVMGIALIVAAWFLFWSDMKDKRKRSKKSKKNR